MKTYFGQQLVDKKIVPQGIDPRHVEGYMRLVYSTLNNLSWPEIRREVKIAVACIKEGGADAAERNAKSFGL